jgi:TANK-binding kinase 1
VFFRFEIISKKPRGIISGIQSEYDGQICWRKDLPETCIISRGLSDKLVPMIANIVECNPSLQWTTEQFFPVCDALSKCIVIVAFNVVSAKFLRVYLNPNSTVGSLKAALSEQTAIDVEDLDLIHSTKLLQDADGTSVHTIPQTSDDSPLIMSTKSSVTWNSFQPLAPTLPVKVAIASADPSLASDSIWSRDVSALCYRCLMLVQILCRTQLVLEQCKMVLIDSLRQVWTTIQLASGDLVTITFSAISDNINQTQNDVRRFLAEIQSPTSASVLGRKELKQFDTSGCVRKLNMSTKDLIDQWTPIETLKTELVTKSAKLNLPATTTLMSSAKSACEERHCMYKMQQWFHQSRDIYQKFAEDKKRQLSYNEDQIHKYERLKLNELQDLVVNDIKLHCIPQTQQCHRDFHVWFHQSYLKLKAELDTLSRLVQQLRPALLVISEKQQTLRKSLSEFSDQFAKIVNKPSKSRSISDTFFSLISGGRSSEQHSRSLTTSKSTEPFYAPAAAVQSSKSKDAAEVNSSSSREPLCTEHDVESVGIPPRLVHDRLHSMLQIQQESDGYLTEILSSLKPGYLDELLIRNDNS